MWEGFTDWTPPERVVELVAAIAAGELDAVVGPLRARRQGHRSTSSAPLTPTDAARQLRLQPYGDDDPVA